MYCTLLLKSSLDLEVMLMRQWKYSLEAVEILTGCAHDKSQVLHRKACRVIALNLETLSWGFPQAGKKSYNRWATDKRGKTAGKGAHRGEQKGIQERSKLEQRADILTLSSRRWGKAKEDQDKIAKKHWDHAPFIKTLEQMKALGLLWRVKACYLPTAALCCRDKCGVSKGKRERRDDKWRSHGGEGNHRAKHSDW